MEGFIIAKNYIEKDELKNIAKAIELSQKVREESWSGNFYVIGFEESAKIATIEFNLKECWEEIIFQWNRFMWNDVAEFAKDVLKDSN